MNVLLLILIFKFTKQQCGFIPKAPKYKLEEPHNLRRLQSAEFQPIRIYFDYTTLDNQTNISDETKDNVKKILSLTKQIYEELLMVQRSSSLLRIKDCDSRVSINDTVSSIGVDADLVVFPFVDTTPSGNTEAYASGCVISGVNNRPVAGIIGFTKNLNSSVDNWMEHFVALAFHELAHVLVFNPSIFDLFIDKDWSTIPIDKVVTTSIINGLERKLIITPKVVEAAKRHFNCSNVIGVELENQGGTGTAGSHWEARVMLSDLMIGVTYDEAVLSEITLAFFEDSGWYKTNKYTGGLFRYGKNEGCGFLNQKCSKDGTSDYQNEFCSNGAYSSVCTAGHLSRAICYIKEMQTNLDVNYRYFSDPRTGGYELADYCPVAAVPTNTSNYYPYSCTSGLSRYPDDLQEVISAESLCFMSTLIDENKYDDYKNKYGRTDNAICYVYDCDYNNQVLKVLVGSSSAICPQQGGYISVTGYVGELLCPRFDRICNGVSKCYNMIDCAINKILGNNITDNIGYSKNITTLSNTTLDTNSNTPKNTIPSNYTIPNPPTITITSNTTEPNPPNNTVIFMNSDRITLSIISVMSLMSIIIIL
jgi:leishmanolysin